MHYKKQPTSVRLKNVQCVSRALVDGRLRIHFYHRPTRRRLPAPGSPEFRAAYEEAERQLAARQQNESANVSPPTQPTSDSHGAPLPVVQELCCAALLARPRPLSEIRQIPRRGLSRIESALYIGVSPSLFDEMVKDARMPAPKIINTRTVWDRLELDLAFDGLPNKEIGTTPLVPASDNEWDNMN